MSQKETIILTNITDKSIPSKAYYFQKQEGQNPDSTKERSEKMNIPFIFEKSMPRLIHCPFNKLLLGVKYC